MTARKYPGSFLAAISILILMMVILTMLPLGGEVFYPWKGTYIGALEGKEWFGLVLAPAREVAFGLRLRVQKEGQTAAGDDFFYIVSEVGPNSPDGQYARIVADLSLPFNQGNDTPILIKPPSKSDRLILEWSRQDDRTVLGRILAPKDISLQIIHYFPWNLKGEYSLLPDGQVQGVSGEGKAYQYIFWTDRLGESLPSPEDPGLPLSFSMEKEKDLYFIAAVGEDSDILKNQIYRYKNRKTIESFLRDEETRYRNKRVKVDGLFRGAAEAITNNLFWMILYQPDHHRLFAPAGRRWIFPRPSGATDHWTIFEWDSFFNALEVSIESSWHVREITAAVLETQYPNGNIPNWRSRFSGTPDRSQPPVGAYVVLKLFGKLGDMELLTKAFPHLARWHAFWKAPKPDGRPRRDGNADGLLEWGSDTDLVAGTVPPWEEKATGKQRAMWESGQDDLPNWEEASFDESKGTLTMNCLDLNCLYALDAYCLAQIANILNRPADYAAYLQEYEDIRALINKKLWNEREGFYFDRHWDGRFSSRKAASNFYPLLARIPDTRRASLMIRHLLDPKEFWGEYVLPTISRDDSFFSQQQYWRGTIWPPTNYLVYQGVKAYGFDAVATEFAQKSLSLFLRSWKNFQVCPENFDSRTGEAGGQRYQSWGPLFALIALEEYLDFTPWEGFRFGILDPEQKGKLSRVSIQGRHYEVAVSRSETKLKEEDKEIIKTNGAAVFRHFLYSENEVSFEIKSLKPREVKVRFLKKGKYQLLLDNQINKIFKGDSQKFEVPEGEHAVLIQLLEDQD
ncbi:MAG: trehalase family glycosidase [Candidatus Aminicenantales bacterium]